MGDRKHELVQPPPRVPAAGAPDPGTDRRKSDGPTGPGRRISRVAVIAVMVFGLVGVLLAAGAGLLVARSALKPIDELAEAAEHVAETQDLAARIDITSGDEVGRLAAEFNAMMAALETSRHEQQRLVRDAGHELRTPLTALRTNIELLGRTRDLTDAQRTELITAAYAEVEDLSLLVGEVVDLASDRYTEGPMEDLGLDGIVASSVERAERRRLERRP